MKVSVIVPVYNVEAYLEKCVKSIFNQTYKDIEIILVDDGSTDCSGEICDELSKFDSRVKVLHKENGGLSSARNYGLDHSTGEYICFIDSDDFVEKQFVEILVKGIQLTNCKISMCFFTRCSDEGNVKKDTRIDDFKIVSSHEILMGLYSEYNEQIVVAVNKLYNKKLFEDERYPTNKIHEDEFLTPILIAKCEAAAITKTPLYYYFVRNGSITQQNWNIKRLDYLSALERRMILAKEMQDSMFYEKTKEVYCISLANCIYMCRKTGNKGIICELKQKLNDTLSKCYEDGSSFTILNLRKIKIKFLSRSVLLYRCIDKFQRIARLKR